MAGVTWWNFYFRLFPGAIRSPQVIEFLQHLRRQVRRKLLVIWDGLPSHRSRTVKDYLAAQKGKLAVEFLPAYAPDAEARVIGPWASVERTLTPVDAAAAEGQADA